MSSTVKAAPKPCASCPYRRDVPSGVWHPEEYSKLRAYDGSTGEQSPRLFHCHSARETHEAPALPASEHPAHALGEPMNHELREEIRARLKALASARDASMNAFRERALNASARLAVLERELDKARESEARMRAAIERLLPWVEEDASVSGAARIRVVAEARAALAAPAPSERPK